MTVISNPSSCLRTLTFKICAGIGILLVVIIGIWLYSSSNGENVDFKPAPTDPAELKLYEIEIFREYLRIPSVYPDIDYKPCVEFLKRQARSLDLPITVYYPVNEKNPMVVMTWVGSEPQLPSIVLNSHMDVVPVYADQWTHPPFAAEMDAEGRIFGRGAQDMKLIGTQYLGAIRALKMSGVKQMKRTIHITFAPNEEIGGPYGWRDFVHTNEFKALNVGFFLDEGIASESTEYSMFYAERTVFATTVEITGESGHGSLILPNTVGVKARYMIDKMMDLRAAEESRLNANPKLTTADVTTINLTILKGGLQANIVPRNATLIFDVRVAIDVDLVELKNMFERWAKEAGEGVTVYQTGDKRSVSITKIDDMNPHWQAFQRTAKQLNITVVARVFPGGTDGASLRKVNVPVFGFSPMTETPVLLHSNDEYVTDKVYLRGIDIYKVLIPQLSN